MGESEKTDLSKKQATEVYMRLNSRGKKKGMLNMEFRELVTIIGEGEGMLSCRVISKASNTLGLFYFYVID